MTIRTTIRGATLSAPDTDVHSVSVELLQREIKKIAALINRSASLDDLDRAWATLCRLKEALVLATIRAKSLAD